MIAGDIIGLSLRNLRQAKLRTALTTLGVSIGIASLAGMVSLGVGLMKRVFAIDVLQCDRCGGGMRLMAAIHSPDATRKILD